MVKIRNQRPRNRWKGSDSHNCPTWSSHSGFYASVFSPMTWENNSVLAEWFTGLTVTHLLRPDCPSITPASFPLLLQYCCRLTSTCIGISLRTPCLLQVIENHALVLIWTCSLFWGWGFNVFVNCLILIFTVLCLSWIGSCAETAAGYVLSRVVCPKACLWGIWRGRSGLSVFNSQKHQ